MGHHWRKPRQKATMDETRSPFMEFLGLLLSVFHPEGDKVDWMPFDPSPSSFRWMTKKSES